MEPFYHYLHRVEIMTSHIADNEMADLNRSNLDRSTPFAISGVSQTQLSIARHYGGCKFKGQGYKYYPDTDELIREDVVKWLHKYRKESVKLPAQSVEVAPKLW